MPAANAAHPAVDLVQRRNLVGRQPVDPAAPASVHFNDYPVANQRLIDAPLEARTPLSTASDAARPTGGAARATRVDWTDFGAALSRARTEDKPILVAFVTGWCGYCRKMDQTTWRDASVIDRLADVIAAKVDAEDPSQKNGYSGTALAERYGAAR